MRPWDEIAPALIGQRNIRSPPGEQQVAIDGERSPDGLTGAQVEPRFDAIPVVIEQQVSATDGSTIKVPTTMSAILVRRGNDMVISFQEGRALARITFAAFVLGGR